MNTSIMLDMLDKLNRKLMRHKRKVLLLLDNVSSHPPDLIGQLSNLNIVFLPKNTTSCLQPQPTTPLYYNTKGVRLIG